MTTAELHIHDVVPAPPDSFLARGSGGMFVLGFTTAMALCLVLMPAGTAQSSCIETPGTQTPGPITGLVDLPTNQRSSVDWRCPISST
jgi:hypothetical protein